jgi:Protein of unknown function (DUF4089)
MAKKPKTQQKPGSKKPPGRTPAASAKARSKPPATPKAAPAHDPLDDFISAASQTLALAVEPSWQPAVKMNLEVILRQAALFSEFSLPDDAEPAPVFEA